MAPVLSKFFAHRKGTKFAMTSEKATGEPLRSGDEVDALTGARKLYKWRPGQRKAAKVKFNRRVRRGEPDVFSEALGEDGET